MVPLSGGRTITNAKVFGAAIGAQRTPAIATSGNVWLRDLVRRRASSEAGGRARSARDRSAGGKTKARARLGARLIHRRPARQSSEFIARSPRRRRAAQRRQEAGRDDRI